MKKEALLKELAKLANDKVLRPNEFTAEEYRSEVLKINPNVTVAAIRGELQRMVKDGILKIRKVKIDGCTCNAYSKP